MGPLTCRCGGRGWYWQAAFVAVSSSHRFRRTCVCDAGERWEARRLKEGLELDISTVALKLLRRTAVKVGLSTHGISRAAIRELTDAGLVSLKPRASTHGSDTLLITPEGTEELRSREL